MKSSSNPRDIEPFQRVYIGHLLFFLKSKSDRQLLLDFLGGVIDETWFDNGNLKVLYQSIFQVALSDERPINPNGAVIREAEKLVGTKAEWIRPEMRACYEAANYALSPEQFGNEILPAWWGGIRRKLVVSHVNRLSEAQLLSVSDKNDERIIGAAQDVINEMTRKPAFHIEGLGVYPKMYESLLGPAEAIKRIPTGYKVLDEFFNGGWSAAGSLERGRLIVLAGRPGTGKSTFAENLVNRLTINGGRAVIFSMEMPAQQIAMRVICQQDFLDRQGISHGDALKYGALSTMSHGERHREALRKQRDEHCKRLNESQLIIEPPSRKPQDLIAALKVHLRKDPKIRLAVIDHVGLLDLNDFGQNRAIAIGEATRQFKQLSLQTGIDILLLCQINRNVQAGELPTMSDLRDSGRIEEDADAVLVLACPPSEDSTVDLEMGVVKNRNGGMTDPSKPIQFRFAKSRCAVFTSADFSRNQLP